jgi:16S rRNA pseudouridine516 synthase
MTKVHPLLKGKKAVLFDLDGTLVDSMSVWSDIDITFLGERGYQVPEKLQSEIEGMSFTETAVYFKERFQLKESVDTIKEIWQEMAMEAYCSQVPLKPGAAQFLAYLKEKNILMAVASSNAYDLIDAALKGNGVRDYFPVVVISCEVERGKPSPDVYLEAARRLGVEPGACLVFEDIVPGILAGKSAGMTTCAVWDSYSHDQEDAKRAAADAYIENYLELIPEYEER